VEKRDGAVHTAAHGDRHAVGRSRRCQGRPERIVKSVRGEGLSGDGGRFERRQADDLGAELIDATPLTVSYTNLSAFEMEANPGNVSASY
jgi:hypothetical protein